MTLESTSRVLLNRDSFKVFGVDAGSIATEMVDDETVWNNSMKGFVANPMCSMSLRTFSTCGSATKGNYPIAVMNHASPLPASIRQDFVKTIKALFNSEWLRPVVAIADSITDRASMVRMCWHTPYSITGVQV